MRERLSRRDVLSAVAVGSAAVAGCLSDDSEADWAEVELEDVTTGETFSIAGLDGTTLVHPFAIWCGVCSRQNAALDEFGRTGNQELVQLNIGDGEDESEVNAYATERGYAEQARFAVAPADLSGSLADEFGASAVNPPLSPVIVRCPDGRTDGIDKVIQPDALAAELDGRC
jgi:hypothetical protein